MSLKDGSIDGVISIGMNKELRHANFHYKVEEVDIHGNSRIYNNTSVIDIYRDVLMAHTRMFTFDGADMEKYRFNPRMYCYDNFGDADLWSVLLRINNMLTCTDFDRPTIRIFKSTFISTLKTLLMLEEDEIDNVVVAVQKK